MFITALIFTILTLVAVFIWRVAVKKIATLTKDGVPAKTNNYGSTTAEYKQYESLAVTKKLTPIAAGVLAVIAIAFLIPSVFYTQDVGQARVLKDWTGNIVGTDIAQGASFKAPWVDLVSYDIRNQQVVFSADGAAKEANGPQITVQDKEGVTANIDITVRYSIDPSNVKSIYERYQTQENFVSRFIENDIRAGVRTVPAKYNTLELLNSRAKVETEIRSYLEDRWASAGVLVETVSLQEIRYSDDVKSRFDAAQSARIEVDKAKAELEATEVSAQQKIVQAKAESQANEELAKSLTEPILKQRYLDTLGKLAAEGNVVVVPEGFNGLVNVK